MITLQSAEPALFKLLPESEKNTASIVTSCILNGALLTSLLILGTVAHHEIQLRKMETTQIYFPVTPPPRVKVKLPVLKPPVVARPKLVKLEAPRIKLPRIEPKPEIKIPEITLPAAKQQVALQKAAAPSVVLAPQPKVALIHLGDLNGATPNPNAIKPATISAIGNPYGGSQGAATAPRGIVGSTGIGNGTQSGSNTGRGGNGGGQGKVVAVGLSGISATVSPGMTLHEPSKTTPPVLISHHQPEYTAEARQLRIEGDVVLRVTITASGEMTVHAVVHGLGHGLDEAAIRSAPTYRFQPATKDGQPVEFTTNIVIKFQTA